MTRKRGLDGKVYRNTGTWAAPTYVEITFVQDVDITIDRDEMESDDRGTDFTGFMYGNKKAGVELNLSYLNDDPAYALLRDAFLNGTLIELAIMDGDITTSENEGLHAEFEVASFGRPEPKDGEMMTKITVKPGAKAANATEWLEIV